MEQEPITPENEHGPQEQEPVEPQEETTQNSSLLKSLLIILILILLGAAGWFVYESATEEGTSEVQNAVETDTPATESNIYTEDLKVGDIVAGMEVVSIEPFRSEMCLDEACVEKKEYPLDLFENSIVTFEGEKKLKGLIFWGEGVPASMPYFLPDNPDDLPYGIASGRSDAVPHPISQEAYDYYGEGNHEILINKYTIRSYPSTVLNYLNVVLPHEDDVSTENWLEYELPEANIKFKYPKDYVIANDNRIVLICEDNPECYREGKRLASMMYESHVDAQKGVPGLSISIYEQYNGSFTDLADIYIPPEEYVGRQVLFEEYSPAGSNEQNYAFTYAKKHTHINGLEALLYRQNGLSMFGQVYNAHFLLPDGRVVVFTSELDNEMLDLLYQTVSLIPTQVLGSVNVDGVNVFNNKAYEVSFVSPNNLNSNEKVYSTEHYSIFFTERESEEFLLRYAVVESNPSKCYAYLQRICFQELRGNIDMFGGEWEHLEGYYFSDVGMNVSIPYIYRRSDGGYSQYLMSDIQLHDNPNLDESIQQFLSTLKFTINENAQPPEPFRG